MNRHDILKHLSSKKIIEFIGDNERLLDYYKCGPVQKASIEDFVLTIIERSIDVMKEEMVDSNDADEHLSFIRGNDTAVVDCIIAFRNQFLD